MKEEVLGMRKEKALGIIRDAIQIDVRTGWGSYLPVNIEKKSVLQDMMECWKATDLQELLNIMTK